MALEFAEINYTLTKCTVARYNKTTNTYDTPELLENGQIVSVEAVADNDDLRGYGQIVALLSVLTSAKVTIGAGGVDFSTLAAISGMSNSTSGTTPNRRRTSRISAGGGGLPYFGLIGEGATDDGGLCIVGLQAVKLDTFPKWTLDGKANKFNLSETNGKAIAIGGQLMYIKEEETAANFVTPATGANFLAFFAVP